MKKGLAALGLGMLTLLGGCGSQPDTASETPVFTIEDFNQVTSNRNDVLDGGILNMAIVTDTVIPGVFHGIFSEAAADRDILNLFMGSLLDIDENYMITQDGAATFEISEDGRVFTFTIRDDVYWHDGYPVTAEDWVFAHKVMSSPEYLGFRFGADMLNVVGVEEFRNGEADDISGLRVLDERTLEMEFINVTPTLLVGAGGIWAQPLAVHIFEDIPIAEMAASSAVRQNPIGFGPFKINAIVPGEAVSLVRNENYWRGVPNLDGINVSTVNPALVASELAAGNVDIATFPTSQFVLHHEMGNVEFLGQVTDRYDFIGFKLGSWVDGENVMDPDAKMADPALRLAMWKAIDNQAIADNLFHGLRWEASTLIPPGHPLFHAQDLNRPAFDPEAAAQILEDAGYVDVTGDGFRENPDGSELVINFWAMTGDETQDALLLFYVQSWESIGLNIVLSQEEFNNFYDHVAADYEGIDIYLASWSIGTNADPTGLYGRFAAFNESRFASAENDRLLTAIASEAALDADYRQEMFHQWQAYMIEQIPVFPTLYHLEITAVNNRVSGFWVGHGTGHHWYQVGVTSETAYRD